jgi:tRNA(Ile)-lysidine synthase
MLKTIRTYLQKNHITGKVCIAVSGGVDSMVLAHLFQKVCFEIEPYFVTVDHRLRDESTAEAKWVHAQLKNHTILTWEHDTVDTKLQEQARDARYTLLSDFAKIHDIQHIFLAHHADDQLETFFLRLLKASDINGLSGIKTPRKICEIFYHRPLLSTSKEMIQTYARENNIPFINDPSNDRDCFKRVFIRKNILQHINQNERNNTLKAIDHIKDAHDFIQSLVLKAYARCAEDNLLCCKKLMTEEPYIQKRILQQFFLDIANPKYPPSSQSLDHAFEKVVIQKKSGATIGGYVLKRSHGKLNLRKENRKKNRKEADTQL